MLRFGEGMTSVGRGIRAEKNKIRCSIETRRILFLKKV